MRGEGQTPAGDKLGNRPRDKHRARLGRSSQATGDADRHPRQLIAATLDFGSMHTDADRGAERGERVAQVARGADPAARAVERTQQAVRGDADQCAPVPLNSLPHRGDVILRDWGESAGIRNDHEHHCGQEAILHRRGRPATDEPLHRGQDRPGVAAEQEMVATGKLDKLSVRNPADQGFSSSSHVSSIQAFFHLSADRPIKRARIKWQEYGKKDSSLLNFLFFQHTSSTFCKSGHVMDEGSRAG